ncbi:MAG TPA: penicillin-binding transpeptidase domain-containing protein [Bacteroidales bacterium]|nr:penicillin-binding transpeptidase domain-containing protein [Bacteroidales bacterium]
MKRIFFIIATALISQIGFSQRTIEKDFKSQFAKYGVEGCFVLFNQADNEFVRYNTILCNYGYIPASTFKIPNSLIALEEGIIRDTNQIIKWDGHEWPNSTWNQNQTLRTAMKYSCVWVFVGFAEQIGIDKYYEYVKSFDYGNKDLTGPPSRFWLAGLFRISANQQIDFLRKFYNYELPVTRESIDIVKNIIVLEQTDTYKLSGKTGGGMLNETDYIMWLVGYIEKDNKPYFYAMNFKTNDFNKLSQARYAITKDILRELKLID